MLKPTDIKFLVVHCSDTPDNNDIGAIEIHKMHIGFGWEGIGYHKIIRRNGFIENGRPEFWIGAHVYGINHLSLGVCLIGRNKFSDHQYLSLENILRRWKDKYPNAEIKGHCEVIETDKTCPNFNIRDFLEKRKLV